MNNETNANEINDDIVTERRIYNMDMKLTTKERSARKPRSGSHQEKKVIKKIPKRHIRVPTDDKEGLAAYRAVQNDWISRRSKQEIECDMIEQLEINRLRQEYEENAMSEYTARCKKSRELLKVI